MVLDDLHHVGDEAVMRQLQWFLTHVHPACCRLLICSRTRPPIAAARLAIGGHLVVLDTEDLAFDRAETRELLIDRLKVELTPEQVDHIVERTDGWPAGIYLAGMALRNGAAPASVLQALTQPDRRTHEYFSEEVLTLLEPAQLRFLEEIAILERFNPELCDHIRDATDSRQLLDELDDNLFVVALDDAGYWKRLHHTFGAVLRARAATGEQLIERHRRAADWYRQHDQLPESVHHLIEAGEFNAAARLIGALYPTIVNVSNQGAVVNRWLDKLPPELITKSTTLSLATAVLAGLRVEMKSPKVLAEYVKTYHEERKRLSAEADDNRTRLERRAEKLKREIDRLVDHLAKGIGDPYVIGPRSTELYHEREAVLAELAKAPPAFEVVSLHPAILKRYEEQLENLQDALAEGMQSGDRECAEAIRELVETVTVYRDPSEPGAVEIEIAGRLNSILGERAYPNGVKRVWGLVVAEDGFEPPTQGL